MNRDRETGGHRDVHTPWRITLTCWLWGHDWERLTPAHVHCLRCGRTARTPVEL